MADEPPNPYTAPAAVLSDGAPDPGQPWPPWLSRLLAVIVSLLSWPLPGVGFYLLGLRRRFVIWMAVGVLVWTLHVVAVWAPIARLCGITLALLYAIWLSSLPATGISKPPGPIRRVLLTAVLLIVAARGVSVGVNRWLVAAFTIPTGAMVPTLVVGDAILVKKGRGGVTRGDVIVFEFPADRKTLYVKRVVAVGGDTIEVREGVVSVNGVALEQNPVEGECPVADRPGDHEPISCKFARESNGGRPYTIMFEEGAHASDFPRTQIPNGEVFVMGDNRDNSSDSRRWGPLPVDHIKGKAMVIYISSDARIGVNWSRAGKAIE